MNKPYKTYVTITSNSETETHVYEFVDMESACKLMVQSGAVFMDMCNKLSFTPVDFENDRMEITYVYDNAMLSAYVTNSDVSYS